MPTNFQTVEVLIKNINDGTLCLPKMVNSFLTRIREKNVSLNAIITQTSSEEFLNDLKLSETRITIKAMIPASDKNNKVIIRL